MYVVYIAYVSCEMPTKGEIIISPLTSRPVKVGGKVWKELARKGLVEVHYEDPNVLSEPIENERELEAKRDELNHAMPPGKQAVKGRGKYKNQVVVRHREIPNDLSKMASKAAATAIANNIDKLADIDEEDIESQLEAMILNEMSASVERTHKPKPAKSPAPKKAARGPGRPRKNPDASKVAFVAEDLDETSESEEGASDNESHCDNIDSDDGL